MAKINFNLRDLRSEKPTPVNMVIRWDNNKLVFPTGQTITPIHWDYEEQRALESNVNPKEKNLNSIKNKKGKKYIGHPEFNESIKKLELKVIKTFRDFENDNDRQPTIEEIRQKLNIVTDRTPKQTKLSLLQFITKFREEAKFKVNPRTGKTFASKTLTSYKQVNDLLIEFNKKRKRPIDFIDIDFEFYTDFVKFLTKDKEYSVNSIGKHIKTLKTILNEATERGINENVKFKSKKFVVFKQATDSVYLTLEELKSIEELKLSKEPKYDKVRDLFLIGAHTGLRFSDFTNIKNENIKNDILEIRTQKTGEIVAIPINDTVKNILSKYEGKYSTPLPPPMSNQKMNEYLKEVCKKVEDLKKFVSIRENKAGFTYSKNYQKFDLITTHTARRSFATNNFKSGLPVHVIMAITGHRKESAFLGYIKITPTENAEIMRLHWAKNSISKVS